MRDDIKVLEECSQPFHYIKLKYPKIQEFASTCRPLIISGGMPPAEADALVQAVRNQMDDPSASIVIRFNTVCAQKRG